MPHRTIMHRARGKMFFVVFGDFPWVPVRVSYLPGHISGPVFLWRCFCPQNSPCNSRWMRFWSLLVLVGRQALALPPPGPDLPPVPLGSQVSFHFFRALPLLSCGKTGDGGQGMERQATGHEGRNRTADPHACDRF